MNCSIRVLRGGVTPTSSGARSWMPAATIGSPPRGEALDVVDDVRLEEADARVELGLELLDRVDERVRGRRRRGRPSAAESASPAASVPAFMFAMSFASPFESRSPTWVASSSYLPTFIGSPVRREHGAHAERPRARAGRTAGAEVPVAAGDLHDRLEALLEHPGRTGQGRQLDGRRLVVRHIGGVDDGCEAPARRCVRALHPGQPVGRARR